jgi:hypothetical protein
MSEYLDAAVRFARRGWPVFPCKAGSKEPATAHGFHDATTDVAVIERFWAKRPHMNVAVATGGDGPDVLDVDVAHGKSGYRSLHTAIAAGLVPQPMAWVITPSGGMHLYYRGDSQRNGSLPDYGLDFRGEGGYVVAAPSHVNGRPYIEVSAWSPEPVSIDFGRLREQLAPRPESTQQRDRATRASAANLASWVAEQRPGNRNQATFWAACRAAEAGDSDALMAIADAAVSAGLPRNAVDKTIASAVRTVNVARAGCDREAAT